MVKRASPAKWEGSPHIKQALKGSLQGFLRRSLKDPYHKDLWLVFETLKDHERILCGVRLLSSSLTPGSDGFTCGK